MSWYILYKTCWLKFIPNSLRPISHYPKFWLYKKPEGFSVHLKHGDIKPRDKSDSTNGDPPMINVVLFMASNLGCCKKALSHMNCGILNTELRIGAEGRCIYFTWAWTIFLFSLKSKFKLGIILGLRQWEMGQTLKERICTIIHSYCQAISYKCVLYLSAGLFRAWMCHR